MGIFSEGRKKALRIFFRRYGDKFIGALVLLVVVAVGWIGYRQTHPKPMETEVYDMEEMLGIDKLGLSCEVRVDGFDGESFVYSIYFDRNVTDEDIKAAEARLAALDEQNSEEEYHGYISEVSKQKDDMLFLMLDLGNAEDDRFIGEILCALDGMEGLSEIVINEGIDGYY